MCACSGMGTKCGVPSKGQGPAHVPLRWDGCSCIPEVGKMLAPREAGAGAQVCIMAQGVSHVLVTGQALGCAVLCWDREQPRPCCRAGSPDRQGDRVWWHLPPAVASMLLCCPSVEHDGWGVPNPQSPPGVAHGVQGRRVEGNVWDQNITMAMTSQWRCNLGHYTSHHPAQLLPPPHAPEEKRPR